MIDGPGCKGNFPRLAWLGVKAPVFLSLIHIYNNWPAYKEIKAKNIKKFVYIPTGIPVSIQMCIRDRYYICTDNSIEPCGKFCL